MESVSWNVVIEPAKPDAPRGFAEGPGQYAAKNMPLEFILATLWDTPPARMVLPDRTKGQSYMVSARIPVSDHDLLLKLAAHC